ncbi:MAG: glyoxalase [bacterium]|nr:glyoxalase [bacterium]
MELTKNVPLVITDKLSELKAFYQKYFNFEITFENDLYLGLKAPGADGFELGFMKRGDEMMAAFGGQGLLYCLETACVDTEHQRLVDMDVEFVQPPKDNHWGDRSAIMVDPIGISLYIYQEIPAADCKG